MATALNGGPQAAPSHSVLARTGWFVHAARAPAAAPTRLGLPQLVELLGGPPAEGAADSEGFLVHRVRAGGALLHEGAAADTLFVVQAGSFKSVKTAEDGYEHVLDFCERGDLLGYDGLADGRCGFGAVALEDSRAVALPFAALEALRRREAAFDAALQAQLSRQLAHAGEIAQLMAAVAAEARLARFLIQLADRMARRGQSARRLRLRMSRRDIANHLGLAHETVSRALRALVDAGCLRVLNREVEILDREALGRCARSTRGAAGDTLWAPPPQPWARAA